MNPDSLTPGFALVALTIIVAIWLALGIRDRRRATRDAVDAIVGRHRMYVANGRCGAVWSDEGDRFDGVHWCDRHAEHVGPHVDTPTGSIRREHESFIGGRGIRLHAAHRR